MRFGPLPVSLLAFHWNGDEDLIEGLVVCDSLFFMVSLISFITEAHLLILVVTSVLLPFPPLLIYTLPLTQ